MITRFVDSFYFLALLNRADAAHRAATRFADDSEGNLLTTDWVLTEVADALSAPALRPAFLALREEIRDKRALEVIGASRDLFLRGLDLYARRPDKAWSLTDRTSFVVMADRGLTEALTGDFF